MKHAAVSLMAVIAVSTLLSACATPDGRAVAEQQKAKLCTDQITARAVRERLSYKLSVDATSTRTNTYSTGGAVSAMVFSSSSVSLPYVEVPALDGPRPGATWDACMAAPG